MLGLVLNMDIGNNVNIYVVFFNRILEGFGNLDGLLKLFLIFVVWDGFLVYVFYYVYVM